MICSEANMPGLMINVKHKRTDKPAAADIYRMNAYADQFDTDVVLVYPTDEVDEKEYRLPKGRTLFVRRLNLECPDVFVEEENWSARISELLFGAVTRKT